MSKTPTPSKPKKPASKSKKIILWVGGGIVGLFILAVIIGSIGVANSDGGWEGARAEQSASDAAKAQDKADAEASESTAAPSTETSAPATTEAAKAKPEPKKSSTPKTKDESSVDKDAATYRETLSMEGIGFDCEWKQRDATEGIVRIDICESSELMLATGDGAGVWAKSVGSDLGEGWAVVGEDYAVVSPDHGTVNRAYDLLGADGEVMDLSKG